MVKEYSILIGGAAGEGTRRAGLIIAKLLQEYGYYIFIYDDYESLINGGHNFSQIRASEKKILTHSRGVDFLLALNNETVARHKDKLNKEGVIIYNSDKISDCEGIGLPVEAITKELGGKPIMKNTAFLGALGKMLGIDWRIIEKVLKQELKRGIELNLKIANTAYEQVETLVKIEKLPSNECPLLTGNEAVALGAVQAGLEAYIAYPMTPATSVLHYLAAKQKDFNLIVFQDESEISVINAAIGSAFAGKRTMVGTSGGGFALMTEGVSLAAQAEVPVVVVESQRTGPATGVPTYSAQADLLFALNSGHGDFVRLVVAPGDTEESFYLTGLALNLAWKYQLPAIVLIDKAISESTFSFDENIVDKVKSEKALLWNKKGEYKRYLDTKNGISPMAFPGEPNAVIKGTSYEHDEAGITAEEDASQITAMQDKRMKKYDALSKEIDEPGAVKVYGNEKSDKTIIFWGSTKGAAIEAAEKLNIKAIQPLILQPFPEKQMAKALEGVKTLISAETNVMGQLAKVLSCEGIKVDEQILKYDGRPFLPEEIEDKLKNLI
ncbi:2-oxoacid:acceptor oxidoreductase subunit alpha [Candidatus Parcubacteria bacterium]|nr:2-oxoacid:acceptor oxidoreductase subunit alpha [Candidatus Parcubacteria bacterium]